MIGKIKSILFLIFVLIICTAQSKRSEGPGFSERPGQPVTQSSRRVESIRATQVVHKSVSQTPAIKASSKEKIIPRVYAVVPPSPVENRLLLHRQHHKYWHPRYNFYEHQYHFYPYLNVVSTVELSSDCVQISFDGETYYYDHWVFYEQVAGGYLAVPPPIGIIVATISPRAAEVTIDGDVYYNHNDIYYKPVPQGYQVVEPLK